MFLPIGSNLPLFKFPIVTVLWIALSSVWFFGVIQPELQPNSVQSQSEDSNENKWVYATAIIPAESNAPWKYFSYQFSHASMGHLFSNMWYLAAFGWILENALGSVLFLLSTLLFGALAVLPESVFQMNPLMPVVGASGSVAFVMGAATAIYPRARIKLLFMFLPLPNFPNSFFLPIRYVIYFWLAMQVSGFASSLWLEAKPVAYATHLTGFALGLIVGVIFHLLKKENNFVDVELNGKDLRDFYESMKAFQSEQIEKGAQIISQLSDKRPWLLRLQEQFFDIALQHKQRELAANIWKKMLPQYLLLRRSSDAKRSLVKFHSEFHELPPLVVQERIKLSQLVKDDLKDNEELYDQLLAAKNG